MNGLEFLAELRNDLGEITVPVMMLTGADNASVAVDAMKCGAQDYLVKDANRQYLELLPAVIQRVLRERRALTEKKQMESRLVQAEAKYRSLIEQIPAIIYTAALDIPGKLLYVSPQLNALGYSPEQWTSQVGALRSYVHPDDRTRVVDAFDNARATGKPLRCEYRLLNRAGEVRWFLDEASLVYDDSGSPLLLQGILIDITKDKQVEEELRLHRRHLENLVTVRTTQLEQQSSVLNSANANLAAKLTACTQNLSALRKHADQLEDLYQNAPCSYHSLDADGVFIQINETGLKWLGRTREEVVGKMKFTDMLTPASEKTFLECYPRFKECGQMRDLEIEIVCKDGTCLSVLLNANAIKDADNRFLMSRSIMFDITDRMSDKPPL
jgi:PAS domain S-box-containing protein